MASLDSGTSLEEYKLELLKQFKGKPISELPTPSFIVDMETVRANCKRMLDRVEALDLNLRFRPHIKTHKTIEITQLELGNGEKHKSVVASTIREIRGVFPLVVSGMVDNVLYGVPPAKSKIPTLAEISSSMAAHGAKLLLMIDSLDQLHVLEEYRSKNPDIPVWSIFLKVDIGDHRAGQEVTASSFETLIEEAVSDQKGYVSLFGLYVHRGASYDSSGAYDARAHLQLEVQGVKTAAMIAQKYTSSRFVLSMGATPTAQIVDKEVEDWMKDLQSYGDVEIHAGNYAMLDIQQVATGLVTVSDVAGKVVAEVLSYYKDRDEYLVDAGVLALAREPGRIPGIALIDGQPLSGKRWVLTRVSQEHGIISRREDAVNVAESTGSATESWGIGEKVLLLPQHACITSSMYQWYFAIENGVVSDVLIPWRGW
ncbi:putative serine dehydratase domain-containing protein [Myxozyma melibiosi]|uniref:Serine dehydratase domain-containing protein n=1 Tax=Myxozyma melibiosi TaxID=54550 RepID=A0ABR1F7Y5_9ASCO